MKRNDFFKTAGMGSLVFTALPLMSFSSQDGEKLDPTIVQEFVRVAHSDFDKVKQMLGEYPTLINAAHDWKMGDFETGLGAASHVGHIEVVHYLLGKGAQINIFTACLLGELSIVKPILTAFPETMNALGPHGFTLLHHAQKGGDPALEVTEYLISLGAKETKVSLY